jgi:peptide/nickel transport system permease protein
MKISKDVSKTSIENVEAMAKRSRNAAKKILSELANQWPFIKYIVKRVIVLSIVLVAVMLSLILIAGGFGIVDRIQHLQIQREVLDMIRANPNSGRWNSTQRQDFINTTTTLLEKARGLDKPYYTRIFGSFTTSNVTWNLGPFGQPQVNLPVYSSGYLVQVLTWDFGNSQIIQSSSGSNLVRDMILERLPRTILLFTTATLISAFIGIVIALIVARKPLSILDRANSAFAVVTNSIPWWWFGMLMIILFSFYWKLLPSGGFLSVPAPEGTVPVMLDILYHMTLPTLTIVLVSFGGWAYVVRSILLDVYQQDFILFARAKGLKERIVMFRHALRAAMPPVVTMLLFSIVGSLGGAIITEAIFDWQGMGRLFYEAVVLQDLPVLIALTFVSAFLTIVVILLLDIIYAFLDPRVRTAPVAG